MSLETRQNRNVFTGNGVTADFDYTFKAWEGSQVKVFVDDGTGETDVTDLVAINVNDTVGGTVTFAEPPAEGAVIAVFRAMPFIQEDRYTSGTRIDPHEFEDRFDQDCAERQELKDGLDRAVKVPVTSTKTPEQYMAEVQSGISAAVEAAQDAASDAAESKEAASAILAQCREIADSIVVSFNNEMMTVTMTVSADVAAGTLLTLPEDSGRQVQYDVGSHALQIFYNGAAMFPGSQYEEVGTEGEASSEVRLLQDLRAGDQLMFHVFGLDAASLVDGESIQWNPDTGLSVNIDELGDYIAPTVRDQVDEIIGEDLAAYQKVNTRAWSSGTDYAPGAIAAGSDGNLYVALQANGPATAAVNPVGDVSNVWQLLVNGFTLNQSRTITPAIINGYPLDIGEDLPAFSDFPADEGRWSRAIQAPFVDSYDKILYVLTDPYLTTSADAFKTQMVAMHWGPTTADRTVIGKSTPQWGKFSHSGTYLWRPSKADKPMFISASCGYNSSGQAIENIRTIQVLSWDCYEPTTDAVLERTIRLFSDDEVTGGITHFCFSYDQKKVIASAVLTATGKQTFRVWDSKDVLGVGITDASASYNMQWEAPDGIQSGGQGIYSDGHFIYVLSGSEQFYIQVLSLDGQIVFNRRVEKFGRDAYLGSVYNVTSEPEGIFWAEYNGQTEMIAAMTLNIYPTDTTTYYRHSRYVALSIPVNVPVFADQRKDYAVNLPLTLSPNTRSYGSTSTNISMCLRLRNNNEPNVDVNGNPVWTGAYIIKYRNNALQPGGASGVQHSVSIKYTESGRSGTGLTFVGYIKEVQSNNTYITNISNASLRPDISNAVNLGGADNLWKEVFAGQAAINPSDERKKDHIEAFPDAVLDAWGEVGWCQYQMKDALAEKGEAARLHSGVIAQRIASIFEAHGLDASRYGLFCYDKWDDEYEEQEDGQLTLVRKAGDGYGIRYAEALAIEAAYQRRRADRAEARIAALERRLNELENVLATLGERNNG